MELTREPHDTARLPVILFFAVPEEARPFVRHWMHRVGRRVRTLRGPGLAAWELDGVEVHVTGMGAANAGRVGNAVLGSPCRFSALVTAGFAGGLNPSLQCGDVVFDVDPSHPMGRQLAGAGARPGRFVEVSRVAVTPEDKAHLWTGSGADAVEMESSTLRKLAGRQGLSAMTVRGIADAATDTLPLDFNAVMTADQRLDLLRLTWRLARSPASIPRLMTFQRTIRTAADALARVLVDTLGSRRP